MTTNAIAVPHPGRIGQATAIEQSRAATEVLGAIEAAQRWPRDETAAQSAVRDVCQMEALAKRAFFRFSRGGQQVSGPTVHLARELARCWGNTQYGVAELRRDDEHGQSEMQAYAWDLETNARSAAIFIVPHRRDKKDGPVPITDARDIYENNANAGARRVRECIFSILPLWLVEQAKDMCTETLANGGGKPLPQRRADAISAFGTIGVSEERITEKVGKPASRWDAHDLAQLTITYASIQRGEVSKEDEFPFAPVTAAQIVGARTPRQSEEPPPPVDETELLPSGGPEDEPEPYNFDRGNETRRMWAQLAKGGLDPKDRERRLHVVTRMLTRPAPLGSFNDLTDTEIAQAVAFMARCEDNGTLAETLAAMAPVAAPMAEAPSADPEPAVRKGKGKMSVQEIDMARNELVEAINIAALSGVWNKYSKRFIVPTELRDVFDAQREGLQQTAIAPVGDFDTLWQQVIERVPKEWSDRQIDDDFWRITGKAPNDADAADVQRYLDAIAGGGKA